MFSRAAVGFLHQWIESRRRDLDGNAMVFLLDFCGKDAILLKSQRLTSLAPAELSKVNNSRIPRPLATILKL